MGTVSRRCSRLEPAVLVLGIEEAELSLLGYGDKDMKHIMSDVIILSIWPRAGYKQEDEI